MDEQGGRADPGVDVADNAGVRLHELAPGVPFARVHCHVQIEAALPIRLGPVFLHPRLQAVEQPLQAALEAVLVARDVADPLKAGRGIVAGERL